MAEQTTTTKQSPAMNRRTLTMDLDALMSNEEDDRFFETYDRITSAVPVDLCSSGSDEEDNDFEDSRMSFASAIPAPSIRSIRPIESTGGNENPSSLLASYDMWMSESGDIKERRRRLLQGMGLTSTKDLLRLASAKIVGAISTMISAKPDDHHQVPSPAKAEVSPPQTTSAAAIVLVRSRSDGDIDSFSAKTKQRKEDLIGTVSKQRLTRTSSGVLVPRLGLCKYSGEAAVRISPKRGKNVSGNNDGGIGSFVLIKNLDTGKEFIVKEYNEQGMWNKLSDVQTGKQLTMEEFERSVGYSPVVKELMGRPKGGRNDGKKMNNHSYFSKSFRNSKRKSAAFLRNIKEVATSVGGLKVVDKEQEQQQGSLPEDTKAAIHKNASQWVKVRQHGKSYKEFTALHMSQEIQAHEGSIWTMKFSCDARFLASAGEDAVIHVWEVQECELMSDLSSGGGTPLHPMAGGGNSSYRPPLAEITHMLSENVFALSEKPVCTFTGHLEDVLDLSWSTSQFSPSNSSEVLITSTDSRIHTYNESELIQKFRGFRNTGSQISASFSQDGKHVITASEDSQVYIWRVEESGAGKKRSKATVQAHEHFPCKDVSVAVPWPGSIRNEPATVEIHSKRHSKRLTPSTHPQDGETNPTVSASSRRHLPPLPKKINKESDDSTAWSSHPKNDGLERLASCNDDEFTNSGRLDPGIGATDSFSSSSASISHDDSPPSVSSSGASSPSQPLDNGNGNQATAWGMVIVTASLDGEIRVYQNFGLPLKVSRQVF